MEETLQDVMRLKEAVEDCRKDIQMVRERQREIINAIGESVVGEVGTEF